MYIRLLLVFLLAMLQARPAISEEEMSIGQAVIAAQRNNPEIRSLLADIAAARGEVTTARTWQNPEVSVAPGLRHTSASDGETAGTAFHGEVSLTQTIEFPGKRALRQALAEKNVEVQELALAGFRFQLTVQVQRAFYSILVAQQVVELREQQARLAKTFAEDAKTKVEGGYAPDFEQTKAEVEVVAARKAVREARVEVATALTAFNTLLGRKPTEPIKVTGQLSESHTIPGEATLLVQALLHNPSLKAQAAEVERTGLNLRSIGRSRLPDFAVGPSMECTKDEQIYGFGVSLPLPLWDSKQGEIATATAQQQKALAEFDKLQQEVLRDVASAGLRLRAAKESLADYPPALREKIKATLDAASQSYAEGRTTLLIYLETQRTYFETQATYFDALQKLYDGEADLGSALGVPLTELHNPSDSQEQK